MCRSLCLCICVHFRLHEKSNMAQAFWLCKWAMDQVCNCVSSISIPLLMYQQSSINNTYRTQIKSNNYMLHNSWTGQKNNKNCPGALSKNHDSLKKCKKLKFSDDYLGAHLTPWWKVPENSSGVMYFMEMSAIAASCLFVPSDCYSLYNVFHRKTIFFVHGHVLNGMKHIKSLNTT